MDKKIRYILNDFTFQRWELLRAWGLVKDLRPVEIDDEMDDHTCYDCEKDKFIDIYLTKMKPKS